ncbi:MAG: carbohydrate-binding family 9-like protein [Draconibacterium sp.]|nr:carbohydrate-binding family 9-like protein [Draconibacterium sp.]
MWEGYEHLMSPARNYVIYQTISEINIDGKPNETSWQKAEWSEYFQDIEGDLKPAPKYQTRFKMLWDNQNLYILAELEEPHIWTYYSTRDQVVFHENDFEIFIDPTRNTHNYFEFEINAQNTLFDLYMNKPYRNDGEAMITWNMRGFKSAVFVDGTLNNPNDIDKKWTVEVAIPFKSLTDYKEYVMPEDGSYWKVNFSRVQWTTEVAQGRYFRKKNKETNKLIAENNWVWSAQGVVNMHFPERWGIAQFSSNEVGGKPTKFLLPSEEKFAKYLWFIYYKQQSYRKATGNYAQTLSDLNLFQSTKTESGKYILYNMDVDGHIFTATLKTEHGMKLSINQDGFFEVLEK